MKKVKQSKPKWKTRNQIAFTLSGMQRTLTKIPGEMLYTSETFFRAETIEGIRKLIESLRKLK